MMMDDRGVTGIIESKSPISEGSVFCHMTHVIWTGPGLSPHVVTGKPIVVMQKLLCFSPYILRHIHTHPAPPLDNINTECVCCIVYMCR